MLTALEELAGQEAMSLEARDFAAVVHLQERAAPLVQLLGAHAPEITDPAIRRRVREFLDRRHETGEWLAEQIEQTRGRLRELDGARSRLTRLAPAYGRPAETGHRLAAVG
ncbi:MAG: hypothetical protein HZA93_05205 [Verrucomicrobia bacterium]|nr:hypothetical protein [Verrucomicrobiota bacterium]